MKYALHNLKGTSPYFKETSLLARFVVICAIILSAPLRSGQLSAEPNSNESTQAYFDGLSSLCGSQYVGEMTFPEDGQDSFAGKALVAVFADCSDTQIKVPFSVGSDTSRTWIFSKTVDGIRLKHDHRHSDGTPDDVSNYGGDADPQAGSALSQSFKADAFTAELIPEAATNVWTVLISADKTTLTYHLERHSKSRFTAVLERVVQER